MGKFLFVIALAIGMTFLMFAVLGRLVSGYIPSYEKPYFYKRCFKLSCWLWGVLGLTAMLFAFGPMVFILIIGGLVVKNMFNSDNHSKPKHHNIVVIK